MAALQRFDFVGVHVDAERFRDDDGAVALLIVLDDGYPGSSHGQPGSVQGVHEFRLSTLGPLFGLNRIQERRVVRFGRGESQVASAARGTVILHPLHHSSDRSRLPTRVADFCLGFRPNVSEKRGWPCSIRDRKRDF